MNRAEFIARVGRKGEIYAPKEAREIAGIKPKSLVRIVAEPGRIIVEKIPSIEELLGSYVLSLEGGLSSEATT